MDLGYHRLKGTFGGILLVTSIQQMYGLTMSSLRCVPCTANEWLAGSI